MKFRYHRGTLADSLATQVEIAPTIDALKTLLAPLFNQEQLDEVRVEPYGFDTRLDEHQWIVSVPYYGVVGFTNSAVVFSNPTVSKDTPFENLAWIIDSATKLLHENSNSTLATQAKEHLPAGEWSRRFHTLRISFGARSGHTTYILKKLAQSENSALVALTPKQHQLLTLLAIDKGIDPSRVVNLTDSGPDWSTLYVDMGGVKNLSEDESRYLYRKARAHKDVSFILLG